MLFVGGLQKTDPSAEKIQTARGTIFGKEHSMNSIFSKAVAVIIALVSGLTILAGIPAEAVGSVAAPSLAKGYAYSDKLEAKITNLSSYKEGTNFEVYVNNEACTKLTLASLKTTGGVIKLNSTGSKYLQPAEKYTIKVKAVRGSEASTCKSVTMTTADKTYYKVKTGDQLYELSSKRMKPAGKAKTISYATGIMSDATGSACKGKSVSAHKVIYVKLNSGDYKGKYVLKDRVSRIMTETIKKGTPYKPSFAASYVSSNKIKIAIGDLDKYKAGTLFHVYVDGAYLTSTKLEKLKSSPFISIATADGKYLKKKTAYKVKVVADRYDVTCGSSKTITTGSSTYYKLPEGKTLYTITDGKAKKAGTVASKSYYKGVMCSASGSTNAGKDVNKYTTAYVKLTEGEYNGKYISINDTERATEATVKAYDRQQKINTVVNYAKSNAGGAYVSCGERFRATDCSGLTMLAYRQIGVNLPHSAYGQMLRGKRVSASEMQPGDIIVANGYNHAMMYIGGGYLVHAMNSRDGIRIQKASVAMYYNPVNAIVRII